MTKIIKLKSQNSHTKKKKKTKELNLFIFYSCAKFKTFKVT